MVIECEGGIETVLRSVLFHDNMSSCYFECCHVVHKECSSFRPFLGYMIKLLV